MMGINHFLRFSWDFYIVCILCFRCSTLLIGLMKPPHPTPGLLLAIPGGGLLVEGLSSFSLVLGLLSPFLFSLDGW